MLQEYPTQIQPRPSSTRETQEQDVEASRTLIDLANQDTSLRSFVMKDKSNQGEVTNNTHQRLQLDPIMLLAAAADVIDKEGRTFERKEINIQSRRHSSVNKKKPPTNNSYRRQNEKRQRYQRPPSTDTWAERTITPEEKIGNDSKHAFSWQYLSMKQNPRIKRNAMHAYITYMIYTDKANEHNTTDNPSKTVHKDSWYLQSYRLPPSPRQQDPPPTESSANNIIDRPLTEFLFDEHRPPSPLLPPSSNARAF